MKIFIHEIDTSRCKVLGYTPMDSFPVHFFSRTFNGAGRFVPADGRADTSLDCEVVVELAQESVCHLHLIESQLPKVTPLDEEFGYRVRGSVEIVVRHGAPPGHPSTYVVAGDAVFLLSEEDLAGVCLHTGDMVEFDIHGLSLWDESI